MRNKKQIILKKLNEAFSDFKFFPEDHHYEYRGEPVGISVTKFYAQYEQEFDAEACASRVGKKEGKTTQEVLDEWKYKNEFATTKGSSVHEYIQSLFSGKPYKPIWFKGKNEDDDDEYVNALEKCEELAKYFWRDYRDKLEHIADEYVIGSSEYDIASCVDHLFINKETGNLLMVDYKTNVDIYKSDKYAKQMKAPLEHIKDTTLNHYALQLSIYKYIIEKYTDLVVEEWFIVWFSEANENYEILEVPYLKDEVENILEWRKWE